MSQPSVIVTKHIQKDHVICVSVTEANDLILISFFVTDKMWLDRSHGDDVLHNDTQSEMRDEYTAMTTEDTTVTSGLPFCKKLLQCRHLHHPYGRQRRCTISCHPICLSNAHNIKVFIALQFYNIIWLKNKSQTCCITCECYTSNYAQLTSYKVDQATHILMYLLTSNLIIINLSTTYQTVG